MEYWFVKTAPLPLSVLPMQFIASIRGLSRSMRFVPQRILRGLPYWKVRTASMSPLRFKMPQAIRLVTWRIPFGLISSLDARRSLSGFRMSSVIFASVISTYSLAAERPLIIIQRGGGWCDPACPRYQIEIYANRRVHYRGEEDVGVIGDRYAKVTKPQLAELVDLFKAFKDIDEINKLPIGYDVGHYSVTFDDGSKVIKTNFRSYHDEYLVKLRNVVDIEHWLCFPKKHPKFEFCPLNNLVVTK